MLRIRVPLLGVPLIKLETTTSTMDEVAAMAAQGAPEGLAVIANEQTAGRGRGDRSWFSPRGRGIYCSVLLRPLLAPQLCTPLSLICGLSIANALEAELGLITMVKWPNDTYLSGGKVAGVLIRNSIIDGKVDVSIVGLGVNVKALTLGFPAHATSIENALGGPWDQREELLRRIFDDFSRRYMMVINGRPADSLNGWERRMMYLGVPVTIAGDQDSQTGIFEGIDETGALSLRLQSGELRSISSGDLSRGPTPAQETL